MISFIIPLRGREDQISGCLHNIRKYHSEDEIIIIEQIDNKPFLRGQLCNLGFKKCKGDLIVLQDVDIRFLEDPKLQERMSDLKQPFLPFDKLLHIKEPKIGTYEKIRVSHMTQGFGGCSVLTREQFVNSNGFSNLQRGWGWEDNLLNRRVGGFKRLPGHIGHVNHPKSNRGLASYNSKIFDSDPSRDPSKDSFHQTVANFGKETNLPEGAIKFDVNSISVPEDFAYKDWLPENG